MDLTRCPKCGEEWRKGTEKCFQCGYVAIGAGLDKVKKKKKKVGRYVEPGSWRGFLSFGTVAGLMTFCAVKQPWTDDWEMIRALFGQGRHHSVVGEWEILKTVAVDKSKAVLSAQKVRKGTVTFSSKGDVKFALKSGKEETDAEGAYKVAGVLIAVNRINTGENAAWQMPSAMNISLAWTGPDSVVATCNGAEAVYLRRHAKGSGLPSLIQAGAHPGGSDTPQGLKDLAGKMTGGIQSEE